MRGLAASSVKLSLFVAAVCLSGCYSVPQTPRAAKLDDSTKVAELAPEYWERHDIPAVAPNAKIVLLDFSVEYVTEKLESPTKSQPVIFGTDYGLIGFVLTSLGVGKKTLVLTPDSVTAIPNEMHDVFVRELESAGFTVVPDDEVRGCAAYSNFTSRKPGSTKFIQRLNFTGSDTGNVKVVPVYPADGHIAVDGAKSGKLEDAEVALLKELKADAVIRARFRVGVYEGRAAVERGSVVSVTTASGSGELRAVKSLLSETVIVEKGSFKFFRGVVYSPESEACRAAVLEIFPSYASLADQALRSPSTPAPVSIAADR